MIKKSYVIVAILLSFFLGAMLFSGGSEDVVSKKDLSAWRSLKSTDDRAFKLSSRGFSLCTDGYEAIGNNDWESVQFILDESSKVSNEVGILAEERQVILKELGY